MSFENTPYSVGIDPQEGGREQSGAELEYSNYEIMSTRLAGFTGFVHTPTTRRDTIYKASGVFARGRRSNTA